MTTERRDVGALVVLGGGLLLVGFGCAVAYGVLKEYADVCGDRSALEQVWVGGAGLGPLVGGVALLAAVVAGVLSQRRWVWAAAAGLVAVTLVGVTVAGALGIQAKESLHEEDPSRYGGCAGYSS